MHDPSISQDEIACIAAFGSVTFTRPSLKNWREDGYQFTSSPPTDRYLPRCSGRPDSAGGKRTRQHMLPERFVAVCLIGIGIFTMLGGLAVSAKCRDQPSICCISFAGVGLVCRD
jgi:hypothetical protein